MMFWMKIAMLTLAMIVACRCVAAWKMKAYRLNFQPAGGPLMHVGYFRSQKAAEAHMRRIPGYAVAQIMPPREEPFLMPLGVWGRDRPRGKYLLKEVERPWGVKFVA